VNTLLRALLLAVLAVSVSACGVKGKLKSPSQIELEDQKKAAQAAKQKAKEQEDAAPDAGTQPVATPAGTPVPSAPPPPQAPPAVDTKQESK
jgi:predicted small lipoprotein YifL